MRQWKTREKPVCAQPHDEQHKLVGPSISIKKGLVLDTYCEFNSRKFNVNKLSLLTCYSNIAREEKNT